MPRKKPASSKRSPLRRNAATAPKAAAKRASGKRGAATADAGAAFCRAVATALKEGNPQAISDAELRRVLTAAVKLYAAKAEEAEREFAPFLDGEVTATETVVAACAMIRAAGLNLFDVAMWFRRPVAGEY
jgi:hypothetical protein